ncbi:hypothetical protein SprV_0602132700 [Sparganum proliferum]
MRSVAVLALVLTICGCASLNALKIPSTTATDASPTTTNAPDTSAYTSESQTTHSTEQATSMHTSESQTTLSTEQASPTHTGGTQTTDTTEEDSWADAIVDLLLFLGGSDAVNGDDKPSITQSVPATQNTGEPAKAIADFQPALWDLVPEISTQNTCICEATLWTAEQRHSLCLQLGEGSILSCGWSLQTGGRHLFRIVQANINQ